jgi:hypothetical protein
MNTNSILLRNVKVIAAAVQAYNAPMKSHLDQCDIFDSHSGVDEDSSFLEYGPCRLVNIYRLL